MKAKRDELIVIKENEGVGGFMCPNCLAVAIGKKWALHANYCPDCGQHIKISTEQFNKLKKLVEPMTKDQKEKCCTFYSVYAPEPGGGLQRTISGIYKKRLDDLLNDQKQIEGQMNITDFI